MSTLRRSVKAVLRPIARPFLRPIFRRFTEVGQRIDELSELAVRLDKHLPIVENAIESQNAVLRAAARERAAARAELERLKEELARAQGQIDALREEILPLTAGSPDAAAPDEPAAEEPAAEEPAAEEPEPPAPGPGNGPGPEAKRPVEVDGRTGVSA